MDPTPISRTELQNLRATLEAKRLQDVQIQQFVVEIASDVIALAASPERKRQYTRREWKLISMTKEVKEGVIAGLRQKFPDTNIYFVPNESDIRYSTTNTLYPILLVDWS
jgi:hypothetical protein